MKDMKRTIAIVCGGDSSEHDVSLRSAQGLYSFFDKERYNIYIVDIKGTEWHVNLENGHVAPINKNDFSFNSGDQTIFFRLCVHYNTWSSRREWYHARLL